MKLFLDHFPETHRPDTTATALQSWYDGNPAVQRLWAIESEGALGVSELRVILMLEAAADSDETIPVWMAHRAQWTVDLIQRLAVPVRLERVDIPLADSFEHHGSGLVRSVQCWRDPSLLP